MPMYVTRLQCFNESHLLHKFYGMQLHVGALHSHNKNIDILISSLYLQTCKYNQLSSRYTYVSWVNMRAPR